MDSDGPRIMADQVRNALGRKLAAGGPPVIGFN